MKKQKITFTSLGACIHHVTTAEALKEQCVLELKLGSLLVFKSLYLEFHTIVENIEWFLGELTVSVKPLTKNAFDRKNKVRNSVIINMAKLSFCYHFIPNVKKETHEKRECHNL